MSAAYRALCAVAVLAGFSVSPVLGQINRDVAKSALVTDRPDQTESSAVVGRGLIQVEVGWSFSEQDERGVRLRSHAAPQALFRVGILDGLEGRFGFAGWIREELLGSIDPAGPSSNTSSGFGDIDIGFKYRLGDHAGTGPDWAFLGGAKLPTGKDGLGSERVDPNFRLSFAYDLADRVSLGSNVGALWTSSATVLGTETLVDFLYTLALGFSVSERVGAFWESFGFVALEEAGSSRHSMDGGLTFLVNFDVQFDVSGGVGLNDAADDWFVGAGLSIRIGS